MQTLRHSVALACALAVCTSCVEEPKQLHSQLGPQVNALTTELMAVETNGDGEADGLVDKVRDWLGIPAVQTSASDV